MKGYKSKSANNICHYIIQLFLVYFWWLLIYLLGFPSGSAVKNPPATQELQETQGWSLGQEDPLEEEMATHSSLLVWRIHGQRSLAGYSQKGSQRVRQKQLSMSTIHLVSKTNRNLDQRFKRAYTASPLSVCYLIWFSWNLCMAL